MGAEPEQTKPSGRTGPRLDPEGGAPLWESKAEVPGCEGMSPRASCLGLRLSQSCEVRLEHHCGQVIGNFKVYEVPNPVASEESLSFIFKRRGVCVCVCWGTVK